MKNIKKYIPLIIVLVIAGLGFAFRENIARAVRGDAYVDNKIFTKQLEKAQKSGKDAFHSCLTRLVRTKLKLSSTLQRVISQSNSSLHLLQRLLKTS